MCPCVRVRSIRATACQALDLEQIKLSINMAHCRGLGLLICFFLSFNLIFFIEVQHSAKAQVLVVEIHRFLRVCTCPWASLAAPAAENPPARQETQVRPLGREEPVGTEMATHSSSLAWSTPWPQEPGGYSPWDCRDSNMAEQLTHTRVHIATCAHTGVWAPPASRASLQHRLPSSLALSSQVGRAWFPTAPEGSPTAYAALGLASSGQRMSPVKFAQVVFKTAFSCQGAMRRCHHGFIPSLTGGHLEGCQSGLPGTKRLRARLLRAAQ